MPGSFDRHLAPGGQQRPSSQTLKRHINIDNEPTYWPPTDGRSGLVVEIEPADHEIVRADRTLRHQRSRDGSAAASGGSQSEDGALQHVGGRRRFRPERALVIIAAVFLVAVLTKPWSILPSPPALPSPSPSSSNPQPSLVAQVAPSTPSVARPSETPTLRAGFADLCPTVGTEANQAPAGNPAASAGATPVWSKIDWNGLTTTDPHSAWGFATTSDGVPGSADSTPRTSWVGAGIRPVYASVPLLCGQNVYAIAVTWPVDVHVSRVSFVYLGEPESPSYLPPSGFVPNAQVTPLPAQSVTRTSTAPNGGASVPPVATAAGSTWSGEFYIPPVDSSSGIPATSAAAAWNSHPWSWPYGAYQVTVTSDRGTTNIVLDLLLT
jgi:hypothetical protein